MTAARIKIPARREGLTLRRCRILLGIVAGVTGFPPDAILDRRGSLELRRARHLYIRLQRDFLGFSQPMIAAQTGARDHTTVTHSLARSRDLIAHDTAFAENHRRAADMARAALAQEIRL